MIGLFILLLSIAVGAGLFYWLIILTEGIYLGPRMVAFLYDRGAGSYDRIKEFDALDDAWDVAIPLQRALNRVRRPVILDVGTGTGRVPVSLLRRLDFEGRVVGLDISLEMLKEARRKTAGHDHTVSLVWKDALALPFVDGSFDGVSCVEALEFMADPQRGLQEMARVLRPGGTLLVTNRIGFDALLMPGHTFSADELEQLLLSLSFVSVEIKTWQTYYDLVWAQKSGRLSPEERSSDLQSILCCPACSRPSLAFSSAGFSCHLCGALYPVQEGIVCMERSRVE